MTIRKQKNEQRTAAAGLLLISFFCITIFSRSSFLYERNPWSDANIFLTIGRGMLKGKKMYTDLFDHKGPLLYVLYAIAAMISDRSFAGVYLIEVLSLFWFLWECWKLLKLLQTEHPFPGLLLIAIAIVTAKAFSFGGGSVEELALPLLMHCLVLSLKRLLADRYSRFCRISDEIHALRFFCRTGDCADSLSGQTGTQQTSCMHHGSDCWFPRARADHSASVFHEWKPLRFSESLLRIQSEPVSGFCRNPDQNLPDGKSLLLLPEE